MDRIPFTHSDVEQSKKIMCGKRFESRMGLHKNKALIIQGGHVFLWGSGNVCGLLWKIFTHPCHVLQRLRSPCRPHGGEAEGGSARLVAVLEDRAGSSASSGGTGGLVCAEG